MSNPIVLQVLPALNFGGVERATIDMVGALTNHTGNKTFVASAGGRLVQQIEEAGAVHLTLPLDTKNPLQILWNAKRLATLIKKHGIQLVHARSRSPAWSAFLAARLTGTPFVTTYHSLYKTNVPLKQFYNSVMVRGDAVIAISQFVAQHIQHKYEKKENIYLIYEGIDTAYFSKEHVSEKDVLELKRAWGVKEHEHVILLPARLTKVKGPDVFIKALSHIKSPNVKGILVGASEDKRAYQQELNQLIQSLGLQAKVQIVDGFSDLRAAYALAACVASIRIDAEAFGRVTVEAASLEKIVIGTRVGATPEVCLDGKTGFLVPPSDPEALAAQIDHVLGLTPEKQADLQQAARNHVVTHFDLSRMQRETMDLYAKIFGNTM